MGGQFYMKNYSVSHLFNEWPIISQLWCTFVLVYQYLISKNKNNEKIESMNGTFVGHYIQVTI